MGDPTFPSSAESYLYARLVPLKRSNVRKSSLRLHQRASICALMAQFRLRPEVAGSSKRATWKLPPACARGRGAGVSPKRRFHTLSRAAYTEKMIDSRRSTQIGRRPPPPLVRPSPSYPRVARR